MISFRVLVALKEWTILNVQSIPLLYVLLFCCEIFGFCLVSTATTIGPNTSLSIILTSESLLVSILTPLAGRALTAASSGLAFSGEIYSSYINPVCSLPIYLISLNISGYLDSGSALQCSFPLWCWISKLNELLWNTKATKLPVSLVL